MFAFNPNVWDAETMIIRVRCPCLQEQMALKLSENGRKFYWTSNMRHAGDFQNHIA